MKFLEALAILGQIFCACLPVYFAMWAIERGTARFSAKFLSGDWQMYFYNKLEEAKEKERLAWKKREKELEERNGKDTGGHA